MNENAIFGDLSTVLWDLRCRSRHETGKEERSQIIRALVIHRVKMIPGWKERLHVR